MRIGVISDTFFPQVNGVSHTLNKMMDYMDKKEIDYRFFVPQWENHRDTDMDSIQCFESFRPWLYPECRLAIPNKYNSMRLKDTLDRFKPDLLHIATEFSLGYMALKYARESGIPVVMSYHTDIPAYLKHYKLQFLESAVWTYFRWFHSFALANLVPSHATMCQLQEQGFSNLAYWKRGIDTDCFSPDRRDERIRENIAGGDVPLLLYVGRISAEKELDVLFDAVEALNEQNLRFKLAVVGDGPYKEVLQARELSNIQFLGYKKGAELQKIYASADVFVFPSSSETYGNVILEAMASGLPVVAPYAGGVKENLVHSHNGLAFTQGNALEMANEIGRLLLDNALRNKLAVNARKSVKEKTWDCVFFELFHLYASVLKKRQILLQKLTA